MRRIIGTILIFALAGCASTGSETAQPQGSPTAGQSPSPCAELVDEPPFDYTGKQVWRLTYAPDGGTAFWSVSRGFFPRTREATIVSATRTGDTWSTPQQAPFSQRWSNIDPFVAPDGQTMLFSSIRPVDGQQRTDLDLWMVRRDDDGWGEPVNLGETVNSSGDELYPSVDAAGNLYFGSDREDHLWDIWRSAPAGDGGYTEPEKVGVNTPGKWEFNPDVSPDGTQLLFTASGWESGVAKGDIFLARQDADGDFTSAVPLCVNTGADEYHPTGLWHEGELIFVRSGKFYRAPLRAGQ